MVEAGILASNFQIAHIEEVALCNYVACPIVSRVNMSDQVAVDEVVGVDRHEIAVFHALSFEVGTSSELVCNTCPPYFVLRSEFWTRL